MNGKSIIDELRKKLEKAALESQRGVIMQPGAIGDCILTLPLAEFMKETVSPGGVDIIGRTEYTGILPGRSCVDGVRSIDSMGLHRLFAGEREFDLADGDPLVMAFAEYTWIATFLGEPDSDFERNLIFTVHCSHSAEVMTLEMKPKSGYEKHITDFYREQFIEQIDLPEEKRNAAIGMPLIRATQADLKKGKEILAENGIKGAKKPIIIQPGSGGMEKCWYLDNFISLAKKFGKEGIETVFILGPAELERFSPSAKRNIEGAGKMLTNLSLAEVLAVLSNAGGYIGNDSGITHLAAGLGVRTVAVFGPSNPKIYAPIGQAVTILESKDKDFAGDISEDLQQKAMERLLQQPK